jgi:hypothetical protein
VLTAGDPVEEAEICAEALESDATSDLLAEELDAGPRAVRHGGVGDVAGADVVVVEVDALGPGGMIIDPDDIGLVEAARAVEVPIWVEAGVGRVMSPKMWETMARRVGDGGGVRRTGLVVGLEGVDRVAGPFGVQRVEIALASTDCPEPAALTAAW